jgi:hypothetical protein
LDVDVIGGLGTLTKKEEKELSLYFKQRKLNKKKRRTAKQTKETTQQ